MELHAHIQYLQFSLASKWKTLKRWYTILWVRKLKDSILLLDILVYNVHWHFIKGGTVFEPIQVHTDVHCLSYLRKTSILPASWIILIFHQAWTIFNIVFWSCQHWSWSIVVWKIACSFFSWLPRFSSPILQRVWRSLTVWHNCKSFPLPESFLFTEPWCWTFP